MAIVLAKGFVLSIIANTIAAYYGRKLTRSTHNKRIYSAFAAVRRAFIPTGFLGSSFPAIRCYACVSTTLLLKMPVITFPFGISKSLVWLDSGTLSIYN
ncbi:MAG TPA: hypothetical protein VI387_05100, partial [Candidatus Brocadiales bacterium]|nr:hypothetical protein [Candidatus Brocadiales bacterium]